MMNKSLKILDCTLRDGGYFNNWCFGKDNIISIVNGLNKAGIDLIECGLLTTKCAYSDEKTLFTDIELVCKLITDIDVCEKMVLLMNIGEYDVLQIPHCSNVGINSIRIAFHKPFVKDVFEVIKVLNQKKYRVYLQPMVTNSYSNQELKDLINAANEYNVYCMYIVDSFGTMNSEDIAHIMEIYEENLNPNIQIGLHAHNNLNLALSNSLYFSQIQSQHCILIDTTIMGIGRGAGNLDLESFIDKISMGISYNKLIIENLRKNIVSKLYGNRDENNRVEYYISALNKCHPNYAKFLIKENLSYNVLNEIFMNFDEDKKIFYDEKYVLNLVERIRKG